MPSQSAQQGTLEVLDWMFSILRLRVWVLFAPLTSAFDCLVVTEGGTRAVGVGWVRLLLAAALFALLTSAFDLLFDNIDGDGEEEKVFFGDRIVFGILPIEQPKQIGIVLCVSHTRQNVLFGWPIWGETQHGSVC